MGKSLRQSLLQLMLFVTLYTPLYAANSEDMQVYLKNMRITPEHKERLTSDINRYRSADNLWDALRESFSLPHFENVPAVQEKINWYMSNQDYLLRSTSRAAPYMYFIYQQVKKRHLPAELVLLPIVESGYNPFSISSVGASGIWQLMPDTATGFGVKQDFWFDGRRDVIASTRAALTYLSYLQNFFEGNWLLAIAAYNTGEGNVLAAIKRNIRDGRNTDFWSLPVAQQTRDYVPSILALATIISHPEQYPIYFPPIRNAPYLAQVDIGTQINLKLAAGLAGISYNKLMQLNPGFNRTSTAKRGPYRLILPIENIEQFAENLKTSPIGKLPWVSYQVRNGDTLYTLARRFNTSVNDLRLANRLDSNTLRPNMELLIPNVLSQKPESALALLESANKSRKPVNLAAKSQTQAVNTVIQASGNKYTLQPGDTIYLVKSNDTLENLAKRFKINAEALKLANNLNTAKLKPGKQIIIPTHQIMISSDNVNKKIQPGDTIYLVRHGDTIDKIAKKFRTTAAQIRLANLMTNNLLQEGDRLTIPTHMQS